MLTIRKATKSTIGTSFHGSTITTQVGRLKETFPTSFRETNTGQEKCNYNFKLELSDGDLFTIYDWKEYRPIADDEFITFHIGGFSAEITEKARMVLLDTL